MLTNQNQIHILIKKLIHIFMHIQFDRIYLQQKATQMLREEHSTRSLGDTYQAQILVPTQNWLPNALVEEGGGGRVQNLRVTNLGKQI